MAWNLINRLGTALARFDNAIEKTISDIFFPHSYGALDLISNGASRQPSKKSGLTTGLKELLEDPFLWAVPKRRRPLEKRLSRKFGIPGLNWKPLVLKTNLIMCPKCGHDHEAGHLCSKCYERVKVETKEIQDAIVNKLALDPVENEVVVLYEGEKQDKSAEFWKGQRIVELPKKRPAWFHSNLLQPTTQEPAETKDVKPGELA